MTVHMIRVIASPGGMTLSELRTALDDWVANHSEWVADVEEHQITDAPFDDYRAGTYRFKNTDAKSNLLQKCEDKLKNNLHWFRLGYHVCDHDEPPFDNCPWDDKREWSDKDHSIPPEVPDFL